MDIFFAVMMLCTGITESCMQPAYILPREYETHYECVIDAYTEAQMALQKLNPLDVEANRMYIVFSCKTAKELEMDVI